jgi:hypothetical protein
VGKRLERVITQPAWKDREGGEAWVAQRLGWVRLRLSRSDLTDNVERNPALPRTTREQTALTAEVASPAWPVLGLTYAAGDTERVRLTGDPRPAEGQEFESLTASAYHAGTRWSVAASSTYSEIRDVLRPDAESATMYHDLSLELRLLDSVSVVPAITVGQERYEDSVQSDTGSGSLTVGYDPPRQRWRASTTLTYTMNRTSDGLADGRGVSASGALAWKLGKLLGRPVTLTFEAGHDRYRDRLYSGASSQSVFGFVLVQFPAF